MTWTPTRDDFSTYMWPNYAPQQVIPVAGLGSRLWDQAGDEYIDFAGGIAVNALGHRHPALVNALEAQGNKLWHLANVYTNEPALRLARALTEATFADQVFFANSGGEANEAALKLARRYAHDHYGAHKDRIVSFRQSFHGRTWFTVSVGGQKKYTEGFGPVPGGIVHGEYNDLASARALVDDNTCAVMVEPMQGEGGVTPGDPAFLEGLRALCDAHDALLIFDEVQCGMGRTGHLYAYMAYGVVPDILTTAKALGGGFPIGAALARAAVAAVFVPGTHGSTYGGNALACAVGHAALETINSDDVLTGVARRHALFRRELEAIDARHDCFADIRGLGLLIGAEFNARFKNAGRDVLAAAIKQHLMLLIAGPNVLRFAPSLVIPDNDIRDGMAALDRAIGTLSR